MNFHSLMAGVRFSANVTREIKRLPDIKTSTAELGTGDRIPVLESFLEQQIQWAKGQSETPIPPEARAGNRQKADALFRDVIRQAWL